jgi:hypothetical protein
MTIRKTDRNGESALTRLSTRFGWDICRETAGSWHYLFACTFSRMFKSGAVQGKPPQAMAAQGISTVMN